MGRLELQPKSAAAAAQLGLSKRLESAVQRTAGHRCHGEIRRRGVERLDIEGRIGRDRRRRNPIADAADDTGRKQAMHGVLSNQYCRDNSQWASERSDSARSPKGASALIA